MLTEGVFIFTALLVVVVILTGLQWYRAAVRREAFDEAQRLVLQAHLEAYQAFLETHGERLISVDYRLGKLEESFARHVRQNPPKQTAQADTEEGCTGPDPLAAG